MRATARPSWHVPKHTGLAADALVRALERRGPGTAQDLVPLDLAGTEYNESDNWVVRYTGTAEIVELGIAVVRVDYTVAAAGAHVIPIKTPPVFDQLLENELKDITSLLSGGKRGRASIRRQAKRLFATFRGVPMLDQALQGVAKLGKDARENPAPSVVRVAEGFISREAASAVGTAFLHVLDKVSPANSRFAWAFVALFPSLASFVYTANNFAVFSPANPWEAVLPLCIAVLGAGVSMLVVSPAGWILSAGVSSLLRLKVPAEYRQRGRNWAPLKSACLFTMSASFVGALYGAASAVHWLPNIGEATTSVARYAAAHTTQGSDANRFFVGLAMSTPTNLTTAVELPSDTRKDVQRFLIAHGYLHGQADGNLGPRTAAAIARYERQERLSPTTPLPELLVHMRATVYAAPAAGAASQPAVPTPSAKPSQALARTESVPRSTIPVRANRMETGGTTDSVAVIGCIDDGTYFGANVCKSPALKAGYQRELREYEVAQRRLGVVDNGVRIEQERWLETVTHNCGDAQCLTSAFDKRTADLSSRYHGG